MRYEWKTIEEVGWAMLGGGALFLFQIGSELDPEAVIADPKAWGIVALGGLIRAACVAGLMVVRKALGR